MDAWIDGWMHGWNKKMMGNISPKCFIS